MMKFLSQKKKAREFGVQMYQMFSCIEIHSETFFFFYILVGSTNQWDEKSGDRYNFSYTDQKSFGEVVDIVCVCVFVSQPPLCSYFDDVYLHPRVLIITETKKYLYAMSLVVCLSLGHDGFCIFPSIYLFEFSQMTQCMHIDWSKNKKIPPSPVFQLPLSRWVGISVS
jgi:hypothetical protein